MRGATIKTAGTAITHYHGFYLSPASITGGIYANTIYSQTWYQPQDEAVYASNVLRRYNGGEADPSKVRAYCAMLRPTDSGATGYNAETKLQPPMGNLQLLAVTIVTV